MWNQGPYLILKKTGPVTYKIQEYKGGRKAIVHADKLYRYSQVDGEEIVLWLPEEM